MEESSAEDAVGVRSVLPGVAKPYRPNAFLRWIYRRFFSHLKVDDAWSGHVRASADRGTVVYVMRSISFLDFLCLDFLLKRFGLPLVRFVNDLGLWILEPFGKGERRLRLKRQLPEQEALSTTVRGGASALLFLRRPPRMGSRARRGERLEVDLIRTLVVIQRREERPILLVPQTFVWTMLPPRRRRGLVDLFFGPSEWPGRLRVFFQFLLNYRNAQLRSGAPFDLKAFVAEHEELADEAIADKVRYALLRRIERERTLVLGPTKKTAARIREELLRSPRVRKALEARARSQTKSVARVERYARGELRRLQANQQPYMLAFLNRVLSWVFRRIYDGIVVDKQGMERVREVAREGTVVYLPSHKSHVDYLVLSYVLTHNALSPPLIAAGDNLGFFPLGPVLRRGGAFFIRRSFRGNKLYPALVDAYIRKLLLEGFPLEFFIEGGRSRTGKLLPPKFGLLSMVVDAALKLRSRKIFFVPISIGYERIVEQGAYVHELVGGEKQKENVGGLLRTPKVLRSRYGRLYVQVGEPLSFDALLEQRTGSSARTLKAPERRALIQSIAFSTIYEIDRATVVTPAALVATSILAHRRRGVTRGQLRERAARLLASLRRRGARIAGAITNGEGSLRDDTFEEAISLFLDAGLVRRAEAGGEPVYRVPSTRRMALEYYKNNLLHFFIPSAMIAAALRAHPRPEEALTEEALREEVEALTKLFHYEFTFRADAGFDEVFAMNLQVMRDDGEVTVRGERVRRADGEAGRDVELYANMLRTYFEAYLLAVRACGLFLSGGPRERKEWVKRALGLGQRMYQAGEIEQRESISKTKLETALKALKDGGLLAFGAGNTVGLDDDVDEAALQTMEARLRTHLR